LKQKVKKSGTTYSVVPSPDTLVIRIEHKDTAFNAACFEPAKIRFILYTEEEEERSTRYRTLDRDVLSCYYQRQCWEISTIFDFRVTLWENILFGNYSIKHVTLCGLTLWGHTLYYFLYFKQVMVFYTVIPTSGHLLWLVATASYALTWGYYIS